MSSCEVRWNILTNNHQVEVFTNESERKWKEPFYFIQGADIQFGLIQRYVEKNPNPGWRKEIDLAEEAVKKINALRPKPKFFIICGDLCDAVPDHSPEIYIKQRNDFYRIFSKIDPDIPVLCVCGNHDIGDNPTTEAIKIYRESFGDDFYSFWCGGIKCIIINTQYYLAKKVKELADEHDKWLEEELKHCKTDGAVKTILFQHIPWFINNVEEDDPKGYFAIKIDTRKIMLNKLKNAGVDAVFCGHLHKNAGGTYEGMDVVVTSAIGGQLGSDKSGMRIVKVYENNIEHTYHSLDEFPTSVQL